MHPGSGVVQYEKESGLGDGLLRGRGGGEKLAEGGRRHRRGKEVALTKLASEVDEGGSLFGASSWLAVLPVSSAARNTTYSSGIDEFSSM